VVAPLSPNVRRYGLLRVYAGKTWTIVTFGTKDKVKGAFADYCKAFQKLLAPSHRTRKTIEVSNRPRVFGWQ
jgi:hypothetical protein